MTNRFITVLHAVVKAGDVVRVKVVEVDKERRRIGLSMRLDEEKSAVVQKKIMKPQAASQKISAAQNAVVQKKNQQEKQKPAAKKTLFNTAMADALSKLKQGF